MRHDEGVDLGRELLMAPQREVRIDRKLLRFEPPPRGSPRP